MGTVKFRLPSRTSSPTPHPMAVHVTRSAPVGPRCARCPRSARTRRYSPGW
jgi:hypothetical protein